MKITIYIYINCKNLERKFVLKLRTIIKMNFSITRPSQTWHHQVHGNNWDRLVDVESILQCSLNEKHVGILLAFCCHQNLSKQMVKMGSLSVSEIVTIIRSMKTKIKSCFRLSHTSEKTSVSPHKMLTIFYR